MALGAPAAIIMRSRSERLRTLGTIQAALAGIALGATLLAIVVSYGVARTITRPLASITDHMRQIAATGDLTRKLPRSTRRGWDDEDAHMLATTFNMLTDSVVRFQRDAAQRERLSSLGRLSTVIAHEVRNPLMIIKGALRHAGADGASAADVRDAAKDIDEEIDRLNSLVNDVLDVARPIRFDPAPTDINAVCRAAVQAAGAGRSRRGAARAWRRPCPTSTPTASGCARCCQPAHQRASRGRRRGPTRAITLITQPARRSPRRDHHPRHRQGHRARMICRASSIHTSRRGGPAPGSASPSPRTSSRPWAARLASPPGAGARHRFPDRARRCAARERSES